MTGTLNLQTLTVRWRGEATQDTQFQKVGPFERGALVVEGGRRGDGNHDDMTFGAHWYQRKVVQVQSLLPLERPVFT